MAESAILQMLNATPQEQAALRNIAMLREQGIPDDQIFAGLADPSFTQAGGAGFLPYITDMASISSSYDLGRRNVALGTGNLALGAMNSEYERQGNPYNVVTALQNMRDTGNSAVLSDPMLQNVQQGPASFYSDYIKSLMGPDGAQMASMTGQPATVNTPTVQASTQQQAIYDAYARDPLAAEAFFSGGNPRPYEQVQETLPTQYRRTDGNVGTSAVGVPTAQQNADTGAQSAAARLLGGTINPGLAPQFTSALNSGGVPGFSSINERSMGLLSPDQRASYMGLVGSTGRVSNPQAAYADFLSKYSMGGSGGARTYR